MRRFHQFLIFTFASLIGLLLAAPAFAGIAGCWKTIDDKTKQAKSYVKISIKKNGTASGVIKKLLARKDDPKCTKCKGAKKGKRITGMEIIWGSKKSGKEWSGGKILDPKNGKVYSNKLWFNPKNAKNLKVRGYVLFFFRTQNWWRVANKLCG